MNRCVHSTFLVPAKSGNIGTNHATRLFLFNHHHPVPPTACRAIPTTSAAATTTTLQVVFESPVWSSFLIPKGFNRNRNWSAFSPEVKRLDQTAKKTADHSFLWSLDQFWSSSVLTSL